MPIKFVANRIKRFFIYRVLSLNDTPHRIALGVAVGIFITWTPTMGFQMILTVLLATLLRAHKFVGIPFVWISNPLTMIPVYGPSYFIGGRLLGGGYSWATFTEAMQHAINHQDGWIAQTKACWVAVLKVFWPLWTGSLVVALILGGIAYVWIYYGVIAYRTQRDRRRSRRRAS